MTPTAPTRPRRFSTRRSIAAFTKVKRFTVASRRFSLFFHGRARSTYTKTEYGNVILATAQYYLRKLRELGTVTRLQEHIHHVLPCIMKNGHGRSA